MFPLVNWTLILTLDIITACQQYQWKYKGDNYIVEASKAHDVFQDPRIIQYYSFYLVEGHMPTKSPLQAYHLLFNYHLSPMESVYFTPIQFLGDTKIVLMVSYVCINFNMNQLE